MKSLTHFNTLNLFNTQSQQVSLVRTVWAWFDQIWSTEAFQFEWTNSTAVIRNQTNPDFCIKLLYCCEFFQLQTSEREKNTNTEILQLK